MFMQTQMFPWTTYNEDTGEIRTIGLQGGLRRCPWGYEYTFPAECLVDVLSMLHIKPKDKGHWGCGYMRTTMIRKLISGKLKPIPDYKPLDLPRYIELRGIEIYPIGIKEDKWGEITDMDGTTYVQELI